MKLITQSNKYKSREEFEYYSVSKLKTYHSCSEKYNLQYVEKIGSIYEVTTSTMLGTLVHAALEYLYGTEDDSVETAEDAFYVTLIPTLKSEGIDDPESLLGDIFDYTNDIEHLYIRASASYEGKDAIRTKSGAVPKAPEMTGVWKKEAREMNLDARKARIDEIVAGQDESFKHLSITDAYIKALHIVQEYVTPPEIEEVIAVELPMSKWDRNNNVMINPVKFPNCEDKDIYLLGYIDNICKIRIEGKLYNCVVDYKTSQEEFTPEIVEHNQQLLMYAYGVEQLLGIQIDYIGILSLRQNKLVYVKISQELLEQVTLKYNQTVEDVEQKRFRKHFPDTKYSTCLNSFGKECGFLSHCWPAYVKAKEKKQTKLPSNFSDFLF